MSPNFAPPQTRNRRNIRDTYSAEKPAESINHPGTRHRNFLPKNGYPADPPDPPRDDTEIQMHKFQEPCDAIAAENAAREAEWQKLGNPPEPEEPDDST